MDVHQAGQPSREPQLNAPATNKVSCTECRRIKSKCIPVVETDHGRCRRCVRLDLSCIFQPHQRGRPKKSQAERPSSSNPLKRQRTEPSSPLVSPPSHAPLQPPTQQISSVRQSLFQSPVSMSQDPSEDHDQDDGVHEHVELDTANSVYHAVANRSTFSIAGVMDRDADTKADGTATPMISDDPVGCGVLTMDESESLFDHYHEQLQTCVCLLDARVHTASYVRQRSPQLFSAVLASASKFFRPELYEPLLAIADLTIERAIYSGVHTIEVVQAICLLHYWKKPTDSKGWFRLGHAIRLAYQLDLHLPRKGSLPDDEMAARLQLDRERTWISLYCFDSTMTLLSDRPSMMHQAPEVESWLRTIPYPLPSDGQLEFAVKTSLLSQEIRQLQACRGSYEVMRSGLRRVLEDLQQSYQALISQDARIPLSSTSNSIVKFSALALQLLAECTSFSIAPPARKHAQAHTCVSTSLEMLQIVIEDFARRGVMPMIEDAHSVAVASTAVRLVRFLPYLDLSARAAVRRRLTKIVIVCREAARGDQGSHPSYLARFIHALVDKAQLSRRPSPAQSPKQLITDVAAPLGVTSTTPDEWWDRVGHLVYQDPVPSFDDQQGFWDGFPILAGVMNAPPVEGFPIPTEGGQAGDPWLFDMMGFSEHA